MSKGIFSALRSRGAIVILHLAGTLIWGSGMASCGRSRAAENEAGSKVSSSSASLADQLPAALTFNEHIQPILSEYCYHCHGPDSAARKPKDAPLRLDLEAGVFAKRESGQPVIVKGDPANSLLIKLVKSDDGKKVMPPRTSHKELKPQEIALLEEWIRQGAKYEPHWSFGPIKSPGPPKDGEGFAVNPIDRFIAQKLAANGLTPNPPEDPRRFYRRLSLDLTGLPPSPADTDQFVKRSADAPQLAVEEAADRLLASSASAEHFTRQWLDAARYGDTHGIQYDNYRAIWPYRDWVIRAFQANMPWDQFTIEQIAGDLLPEPSLDQLVATGFNRCLITTNEGGAIPEEYEAIYAKDRTETLSGVWLGLTTGCAACHDHKFDPFSTKDFYSLTAFFRNNTMAALDGDSATPEPTVFVPLPEERQRWAEVASEISATGQAIKAREEAARPGFGEWLSNPAVIPPAQELDANPAIHLLLGGDDYVFRQYVDSMDGSLRDLRARLDQLKEKGNELRARGSMSLVMEERKDSAPFAHVLTRGVYSDKGEKVEATTPAVLPPMAADAPHNRLGLARWLVDPANPLPARVTMNRMWTYYFGTGIVETVEDFGVMGARPSHPRLLDWLAHEFIASKWDYRHMVRLLVTSATYRQSAATSAETLEKDPLNRLLSRGPRVRLDGEQLRDLALAASGLLVDKVGGPPVKPYQPEGVWETIAMAASNTRFYKQDVGEGLYRRSLYTFWKRSAPPPSMELFNAPSREVSCVRRERTNTPLQALVMLNDLQFLEASKWLAAHALEKEGSFDARLDFITARLLNRALNPDERKSAQVTLDRLRTIYTGKPDEALKLRAAGEKSLPAGLDPIELAAWTVFSSEILNLDETITR